MRSALFWDFYAAWNGSFLPAFRDNLSIPSSKFKQSKVTDRRFKMVPIVCPETSIGNYHCRLRKIPKECRSQTTSRCWFMYFIRTHRT